MKYLLRNLEYMRCEIRSSDHGLALPVEIDVGARGLRAQVLSIARLEKELPHSGSESRDFARALPPDA